MAHNQAMELNKERRALNEKHTYFLMASAGACIGFAMTQVKDLIWMHEHAALGVALACWGASFWFGCLHIFSVYGHLGANIELLNVSAGVGEYSQVDPNWRHEASVSLKEILGEEAGRGLWAAKFQYLLLILGVAGYVEWQILLMLART